jgi:hypothetical protein
MYRLKPQDDPASIFKIHLDAKTLSSFDALINGNIARTVRKIIQVSQEMPSPSFCVKVA